MTHRNASRTASRSSGHFAPHNVAERLLAYGPLPLSDVELVSLFLRGGPHGNAIEVARALLDACGGIVGLIEERRAALTAVPGVTDRNVALLCAGRELARRAVFSTFVSRDVLSSPDQVRQYLALHLTGLEHEVFAALFLDNRHRVIEYRELFRGTIDSAAVYPREVVKRCLSVNAAAVIFAHNHPSGTAEPSDTDVRLTRKLVDALALVDVRVLDHLVVGQGVQTSLAERGLM